MITKQEISHVAAVRGLNPHVVEKDYILGWILAGIYNHTSLKNSWIFKGGTCFKKCYFETYRFSEDLDFTVIDPSHLDRDFLTKTFSEISAWLHEQIGIEIPTRLLNFDIFMNPRGSESCQGKIGYRGPISPRVGFRSLPRLKIDLTFDELLAMPPIKNMIYHDYSDDPLRGVSVQCYILEEAFAEKTCALGQRARPRDLYDVINLLRNDEAQPNLEILNDLIHKKCAHRGLTTPSLVGVQAHRKTLEDPWGYMLGHQLQEPPPFESYFDALPEFFNWLATGELPTYSVINQEGADETVLREPTMKLPISRDTQIHLEVIRFSAVNYLCVDLQYGQSTCRIEPYSLRRTKSDDILLHAVRVTDRTHQIYQIDQINGATSTNQNFVPRYLVELRPRIRPS